MNPENTTAPNDPTSQQPLTVSSASVTAQQADDQANPLPQVVVSHQEPPTNPVGFEQQTSSYSKSHLFLVLLIALVVAGGSIAGGVSLINKSQKPFQSSGSSGGNPTNWASFSNQDGNFSAMFPTTPQAVPQKAQAGQQGGTVITKGFQSGNENTGYAVVYSTFSSDIPLSSDSNAVLQGSVQAEVSQLQGGQIVSSNSTTVSGHPAETYEVTGTTDGKNLDLTGELVLVNRVLYNVFTTQLNSQAPNTQYFLNSFRVGQ